MAPVRCIGVVAAALGFLKAAQAGQSITNCGGPGDLIDNLQVHLDPDPISKFIPLTIKVTGKLTGPFSGGVVNTDMDVAVTFFGKSVYSNHVTNGTTFFLEPAIPAGPLSIVIGPLHLPPIPGNVDVTGKVVITTPTGAPIACLALDVHSPLASEVPEVSESSLVPRDPPAPISKDCGKPTDHVKDIVDNSNATCSDVTGTFDEPITQMFFNAQLELTVESIPFKFAINAPVAYQPGFVTGPFHVGGCPFAGSPGLAASLSEKERMDPPTPAIQVTGKFVWVDGHYQEILCREWDAPLAGKVATEAAIVV